MFWERVRTSGITLFNEIVQLIEPTLRSMGFELVQVRLMGTTRRTLQVMAEPIDRARPMTIDDCVAISHALSAVLDVADPIEGNYSLEVSTPGIDRPLVRPADYERFRGHVARVETELPIEGRRRFTGRLEGLDGDDVRIVVDEVEQRLPLARIKRARLVLEDELAAAGGPAKGRRRGGKGV